MAFRRREIPRRKGEVTRRICERRARDERELALFRRLLRRRAVSKALMLFEMEILRLCAFVTLAVAMSSGEEDGQTASSGSGVRRLSNNPAARRASWASYRLPRTMVVREEALQACQGLFLFLSEFQWFDRQRSKASA